jgi:hypothetical protein
MMGGTGDQTREDKLLQELFVSGTNPHVDLLVDVLQFCLE